MKNIVRRAVTFLLRLNGFRIEPLGLGFLSPKQLLEQSKKSGLTLCDYIETKNIGGIGRRRDHIIESLSELGALNRAERILEIGPGTGMFLERVLDLAKPVSVELYEPAVAWRTYLLQTYSSSCKMVAYRSDGCTLRQTGDCSVNTIFAHGVFVYLPIIQTIGYLAECIRVLKPNGLLVFDVFLDSTFDIDTIQQWRQECSGYVFPVMVSRTLLTQTFSHFGLDLIGEFNANYHAAFSTYFILMRRS